MTAGRQDDHYGTASIALHWLMLLLLVGAYAAIELREAFPRGSDPRAAMKSWHFALGLSVLALVWFRIAARLIWRAPAPIAGTPRWQQALATTVHAALYLFMIAMPLAGWLLLSAEGEAVRYFGVQVPALMTPNKSLAEGIEEVHEAGGTIGYWLIAIHAAAALFHRYVLRDRLMARMLPSRI